MKQRTILLLTILLMFSLAACGGGDDNNDDATSSDSSDQPAATTASDTSPTTDPSSGGGAAAPTSGQTVEVEGGTLSFELPDGWVANTEDGIVIANSDAALAATNDTLEAGQIRARIDWVLDDSEALSAAGLRNTTPPMQALPAFIEAASEEMVTYEMGTPRSSIAAGSQQAMSVGTVTYDSVVMEAMIFAMDKREGYFLIFATAPTGEVNQYEGDLRNVLASVAFAPAG